MEKKELTIEELEEQATDLGNAYKAIIKELDAKKKAEKEKKEAKLALEKEARYKEVEEAYENYRNVLNAYIKDYGKIQKTTTDLWPWCWWE